MLTPEQRLLGSILAADWSAGAKRVWPRLEESIDWRVIPDLAWQYKMRPMMAAALREANWPVPSDIRAQVEAAARECVLKTTRQLAVLPGIIAAASDRDVRFVALKGLALSACLYGDLFIREAFDLDILIDRRDVGPMMDLLVGLGFRSARLERPLSDRQETILGHFRHDDEMVHAATGTIIDLHQALDYNPYRQSTNFEAIWRGRSQAQIGPHRVPIPGKHDLLYLTMAHAARHGWERWKWLGDLVALFRQTSAEDLASQRRSTLDDGFQDAFDCSLLLVSLVTGWQVPIELAPAVSSNGRAWRLMRQALRYSTPGLTLADAGRPKSAIKLARYAFLWKNWRGVGFQFVRNLHWEKDWRTLRWPDYLIPGYYFLRIWKLLKSEFTLHAHD